MGPLRLNPKHLVAALVSLVRQAWRGVRLLGCGEAAAKGALSSFAIRKRHSLAACRSCVRGANLKASVDGQQMRAAEADTLAWVTAVEGATS